MLCRLQLTGLGKNRQGPKTGIPKEEFPLIENLSQILLWASDLKIEAGKSDY